MRLYAVTNMYISGIHSGIQCQHSTTEMFVKYKDSPHNLKNIYNWAENHKTTVVLNGGLDPQVQDFLQKMKYWEEHGDAFEYSAFYEPGIGNALTSISVLASTDGVEFMNELRATDRFSQAYDELSSSIYRCYGKGALEVLNTLAFMPSMR